MKIYRLEHPIYGTPYRADQHDEFPEYSELFGLLEDMAYKHNSRGSNTPNASREFPEFQSGYHYCGCASEKQLREWFRGWVRPLQRHGFEITVYEVDIRFVSFGELQCIFPMVQATRV